MQTNLTLTQIAATLAVPRAAVGYAVRTYGPSHKTVVGTTRVWAKSDLPAIRDSLARVAANRRTGRSSGDEPP